MMTLMILIRGLNMVLGKRVSGMMILQRGEEVELLEDADQVVAESE
jgi:hypothetical protein